MCYAHGSIDQAVNWARTNPPPKQAGFANPGWPGCCRAPTPAEHKFIQPADWRSVSVVHQVSIPLDIKVALESLGTRGSPVPSGVGRAGTIKGTNPPDRKLNGSPSRSTSLSRSAASSKQWTGSPKQTHSSIGNNLSRNSSSAAVVSTSVPTLSTMEHVQAQRRQSTERRGDSPHSSNSPPKPKNVDLDGSLTPRRNSSAHKEPSNSPSSPSVSLSKVSTEGRSPLNQTSVRQTRRSSVSNTKDTTSVKSSPSTSRTVERPASFVIPRSTRKDGVSSASSSSGSDGTGSMTDSTITSDGGFTDYLSDESEAELQRQAEARAALLAQYQAEELEFKAARQQLAHIDLQPPKSWNPTNITNRRLG
ncbi:hypothetical protein C0995_001909 [Termitomyces sp. Mi166|nr:hypothetical protein C0995_001909 [Termitomyces sp. Mi166\